MVNPLKSIFNKKDSEIKRPILLEPLKDPIINEASQMETIAHHFGKIMETLGLDLEDESIKDTPKRVAKMYIKEIFSGLNPENVLEILKRVSKGRTKVDGKLDSNSVCKTLNAPFFEKN